MRGSWLPHCAHPLFLWLCSSCSTNPCVFFGMFWMGLEATSPTWDITAPSLSPKPAVPSTRSWNFPLDPSLGVAGSVLGFTLDTPEVLGFGWEGQDLGTGTCQGLVGGKNKNRGVVAAPGSGKIPFPRRKRDKQDPGSRAGGCLSSSGSHQSQRGPQPA